MAKKLSTVMSQDLSYNDIGKAEFLRVARAALRSLAKQLGLQKGEFDLRTNKAGIAVSGEVTLHTDTFWLQVSQPFAPSFRGEIMYRACNGRSDYGTGNPNQFAPAECLDPENIADFANRLRPLPRAAA